jgi:nucleoside-diphosphate-sugar epimerase
MTRLPDRDLAEVLEQTETIWPALKGARILITGGTGFFGSWLLESLCHANRLWKLGTKAVVLTRNPEAFRRKAPHIAEDPAIELLRGDVLELPDVPGECSHLIHAATDASAHLLKTDPLMMLDTVLLGTRNVLGLAASKGVGRALFTSSGAVYGRQPWDLERIPDDWPGAPDCTNPGSAYAEGKRAAENLCAIFSSQHGLPVSIARCFAFLGPYLPLDTHFAIGNFIRDAMQGGPLIVNGDGTPFRSYLYASDLTAWLWHLLVRGESTVAVNVGSEESISIGELADRVARTLGGVEYRVLKSPEPGRKPERYVPGTSRARDLGLEQTVSLEEGILRTARWHGYRS